VSVATIVRGDMPLRIVQIVGLDVDEGVAEALVACGQAAWGPEYEAPPAVYVIVEELGIGDAIYPEGAMLTVGREITEAECVLLIRGDMREGGGVVSVPQGGVG
jgi:hypothetical protein